MPSPVTSDGRSDEPDSGDDRIDTAARSREGRALRERAQLPRRAIKPMIIGGVIYVVGFIVLTLLIEDEPEGAAFFGIVFAVVGFAFLFESVDAAAGMGFGTSLAPVLLLLGFDPLLVVPALVATQAATGILGGTMHHEFRNIEYSWPPNSATKTLLLIAGLGSVGAVASVLLAYSAFELPEQVIKIYVAVVVILMGVLVLVQHRLKDDRPYRPHRLSFFATLAGVNKGIASGGFGPVVTLGGILSGVIEKTSTAITTLSEGMASTMGTIVFVILWATGTDVSWQLLPSLWLGAFPAAVLGPYIVRVVPNRVWRYVIPVYSLVIGAVLLFNME